MKILVTGAKGFVGKHVVDVFKQNSIIVVEHRGSSEHDFRDRTETRRCFEKYQPTHVIHLAAKVGGIGANQKAPGQFIFDNLQMGLNLIEMSRIYEVTKFMMLGTVCSYPKHCEAPFREADLWNGYPEETNAPYGIAKRTLSEVLKAYNAQYKLNGVTVISTNTYGPGDNFDAGSSHVIPAMIRKFAEAKKRGDRIVRLWGTGLASRDFVYVTDLANAIFSAFFRYDNPTPINISSGTQIHMRELAKMIAAHFDYTGEIQWDTDRPDGQPQRLVSFDAANQAFGYSPSVGLAAGIWRTIDWFRNNPQLALAST